MDKVTWEYKMVRSWGLLEDKDLGLYGDDGWELVGAFPFDNFVIYHFKRKFVRDLI